MEERQAARLQLRPEPGVGDVSHVVWCSRGGALQTSGRQESQQSRRPIALAAQDLGDVLAGVAVVPTEGNDPWTQDGRRVAAAPGGPLDRM